MKHLFTMLLALIAVTANAQDFMVDGICYNILSQDDKTVEVTKSPYDYAGDVVIPAEVTYDGSTYSVTTIGESAFSNCYSLTSVSMPSVTTIGDYAFWNCSALTSAYIPASCTCIGRNPFIYCNALKEIVVDVNNPNFSSQNGVMYDKDVKILIICPGGKNSVDVPSSVTTIGDHAFYGCGALTSVSMPSVTTIGEKVFYECNALASISMLAVKTIGDEAFNDCSALTSVDMPAVTTIGDFAFEDCDALTSAYIPASCTCIGRNPFSYCNVLKEIVVDVNNPNFSSQDGVIYDKGVKTLIACPGGETFVDVPSSVTTIGDYAFYGCGALTSVSMPSVTMIGDYAFCICDDLKSVSMPVVTMIGDFAFYCCYALISANMPATVTTIGYKAFYDCIGLTSVHCHWEEPLECDPWFTYEVLENAILFVPTGAIDAYRSVDPWRWFINIEEMDYSAIADIPGSELAIKVVGGVISIDGGDGTASAPIVEVYSTGGVCVYRGTDTAIGGLGHGVYVVKVDDTVQKVVL